MKTEIENLLNALETIIEITPETPTINGHPISYYIKHQTIDENNDDDHCMYVLKLENNSHKFINTLADNSDEETAYYNYDTELIEQFKSLNPDVLLSSYGPWHLVYPIPKEPNWPSPVIYTTDNHDTFTINVTDYHIIITVILSGMY